MKSTDIKAALFISRFDLSRTFLAIAICTALLFSIFFRVWAVDRIPGVNGDEAVVAVTIHEANIGKPVVLRMPTGRMFSPVYAAFAFLIDQLLPRSLFAIRLPALIAGFALLFLTFLFMRKRFGLTQAWLAAVLVAVSPANIAYARSGVEQSFTGVLGILLCFLVSESTWWAVAVFGVVAISIHPTNVFIVPILVFLALSNKERITARLPWILAGVFAVLALIVGTLPSHFLSVIAPTAIFHRATDFKGMMEFASGWLGLVSGTSAIEQFVGYIPVGFKLIWNSSFGVLLAGLVGFGLYNCYCERRWTEILFVSGTIAMTVAYYLVSGNFGIEPGVLRYAMVLLNPALLSLAILIHNVKLSDFSKTAVGAGLVIIFLFQMAYHFFYRIQTANSSAHPTYKTGRLEPKEVAFQRILSNARHNPTRVLVEDWWTYWPLKYLSLSYPHIQIELFQSNQGMKAVTQVLEVGGFIVGPAGGNFESVLQGKLLSSVVEGYGQEKVLWIWAAR